MKASRIALPEVYGAKKMLDTDIIPERQKTQIHNNQVDKNRPRLGTR